MDKINPKTFYERMLNAYYKDRPTTGVREIHKELDKVCNLLAWLCCHADEDCPSEYRTHHFTNALDDSVDYLEKSGWYEFNKNRKEGR
jgi:hypothetical protein